ncbi:hypothetical protein [Methylobacterium isbiliense]|uniref:hypothetical protein n=1 Tax=Methylobacterium isbiliense TaxID=315478 RepID=UPI001EDD52ED|nr:hypothetical protein [Methylobacterium isbiliense]MDN3626011.1 hypothetical protein [Methylobacterium isbiliense]
MNAWNLLVAAVIIRRNKVKNIKSEYEKLNISLQKLIEALEEPMKIASQIDDLKIKLAIGELSADIIGKIDYEIKPMLNK